MLITPEVKAALQAEKQWAEELLGGPLPETKLPKPGRSGGGITAEQAAELVDGGIGLLCAWWRALERSPERPSVAELRRQARRRLTEEQLELHLRRHDAVMDDSAFISLSAGVVERRRFLESNLAHPARVTALDFATDGARRAAGFLFVCWVVVALNPAAAVEGLAEEVRELQSYRAYYRFQTEGEITAKLCVPANQIAYWEEWTVQPYDPAAAEDPEIVPWYDAEWVDAVRWVRSLGQNVTERVQSGVRPVKEPVVGRPGGAMPERYRPGGLTIHRDPPRVLFRRERTLRNRGIYTDPATVLNVREMVEDERPLP